MDRILTNPTLNASEGFNDWNDTAQSAFPEKYLFDLLIDRSQVTIATTFPVKPSIYTTYLLETNQGGYGLF